MKVIDLFTKVIKTILQEPRNLATQWINTPDFCLDDIIGKNGDHIPSFLYTARQLAQLQGRKVKSVTWHVINDHCAVDSTIGFFRIELEPE